MCSAIPPHFLASMRTEQATNSAHSLRVRQRQIQHVGPVLTFNFYLLIEFCKAFRRRRATDAPLATRTLRLR